MLTTEIITAILGLAELGIRASNTPSEIEVYLEVRDAVRKVEVAKANAPLAQALAAAQDIGPALPAQF